MKKLLVMLKKDFLVISRDIHALGVLFVLPVLFIVIMSLTMQDLFDIHVTRKIEILLVNRDTGPHAQEYISELESLDTFTFRSADSLSVNEDINKQIYADGFNFALVIGRKFSSFIESDSFDERGPILTLLINPIVGGQTQTIIKNALLRQLEQFKIQNLLKGKEPYLSAAGIKQQEILQPMNSLIESKYVYKSSEQMKIPTSVQQNVPAWLVFSMFLIVIPISNTFITERDQGTIQRLKSMNVSRSLLILGKITPYFIINIIQTVLMILVGIYGVPLLGGDSLSVGHSFGGLCLIAASVSFCAIAFALCIASLTNTTAQATAIGGFGNIVLGALGGIMVPKFVMPEFMQTLAGFSPMNWGLEGFLDITLREGRAVDVLPESGLLVGFGLIMVLITSFLLKRKIF
jgi:ABC-2 type transport system permease protein